MDSIKFSIIQKQFNYMIYFLINTKNWQKKVNRQQNINKNDLL